MSDMNVGSSQKEPDCAICLQKCNHPTRLPCGHVFCFLCVKGIAYQSKKCAMCRAQIPPNYLDNPVLLESLTPEQADPAIIQETYQWFYEGRNGWWKYDERSNSELETAYNSGEPDCTLLLAGTLYVIDFQSMTQLRRSDQTRRRRVRRDTPMFPAKGIAGIKTDNTQVSQSKSDVASDDADVIFVQTDSEVIELSDSEDVELVDPAPIAIDDVSYIVERVSIMNLTEAEIPSDREQDT